MHKTLKGLQRGAGLWVRHVRDEGMIVLMVGMSMVHFIYYVRVVASWVAVFVFFGEVRGYTHT